MSKTNKANTSTRQNPSLSNRRMGIAAAILGLCFLIVGTYSLQNQEDQQTESIAAPLQEEITENNADFEQTQSIEEDVESPAEDFESPAMESEEVSTSTASPNSLENTSASRTQKNRAAPAAPINSAPRPKQIQSAVKWAGLDAAIEANNLQVNWKAAIERNTAYFEIERSIDDENFEKVGRLEGQGMGSFEQVDYKFADEELRYVGMPRVYYRIKQIGMDDNVQYSDVYEHDLGLNLGLYIRVEDIQNGFLTLVYAGDEPCEARISIITPGGEIMYEDALDVGFTPRKMTMNASILGKGIYLLVLQNDRIRVSEMLEIRE